MAFAGRTQTTFGQRPAGTTGGGFQRTGGGFGGGQQTTQSFAQPQAGRFGGGAAPTGFGANRPTTGFGGQQAQGGFGGQQPVQQQQQGGGVPNYRPTDYTEPASNGAPLKCELRAISGMDFYSQYSYEQLRWMNLQDPATHPAQQQQSGTGFGQRTTGFGQQGAAQQQTAGGFGQQRTGFGTQGAQQQTQQTASFGQQRTGFGQQTQQQQTGTTGGFGQQRTGFGTQGAAAAGSTGGFGQRTGTAGTTGFGAKTTGFGTQGAAAGSTGGFGQRTGFGGGQQQQQPVFQQQGTGFGGAAKTGFGAQGTGGGFGNQLRVATGVNRDGTAGGAATTGFGARPAGGFGTGAGYGQQQAQGGFGAGAGGFQRTVGYGAAPQAVNEPVYYTTISTAPFGILPQILKDTAAAAPKQPSEASKSTIVASSATMSASKRKHAMLPHYKLTPRSESRQHRLGGVDAEATGRDMFVSKMGGVKKLVIEPTDTEQSALFNPSERARLRTGIATASPNPLPSTPSSHHMHMQGPNFMFTSPNVYAATPSFPHGPAARQPMLDMNQALHAGGAAGGPISIYASPAHGANGNPLLVTSPAGVQYAHNSQAPRLTLPGCYTIPAISELRQKSAAELSRLTEFTIGHSTYGMVTWKSPTDVRNLNLDLLVEFTQDSVDVYPEAQYPHGSPADGVLNKSATVTIFNVNVHRLLGKQGKSPARNQQTGPSSQAELEAIIAELQRITTSFQGRFISFVPDGNKWVFEVDHFTRYGLNGSNAVNPGASTTAQSSPNPSPTRPRPTSSSIHPSGRTAIPSQGTSIKSLKIDKHGDSDNDSDSDEPVQPLLPFREPPSSISRAPTVLTSNGGPQRKTYDSARPRGSSAGSSDHSLDDHHYDDDDMLSAEGGALTQRSMRDELGSAHSDDGMFISGDDYDDEEDEEETYGESEEDYEDDEDSALENDHLDHQSDFSHSDSASMHHQDDRYEYSKHETASMASHRSGASSRVSHAKPHPRGARSARGSALDGTPHEGTESRFSRQSSAAQRAGATSSHLPSQRLSTAAHPSSNAAHGNFRSPRLARQLGLDARHMQQMKADFFPPSASGRPLPFQPAFNATPKFQSSKRQELVDHSEADTSNRTYYTPGWDAHAAKRFKSSNPPLSEVKLQAAVPAGGHMVRVLRIPPPPSFPASAAVHRDASLPMVASKSSSSEPTLKPVPLSDSVTKGASEIALDSMLFQGRSMRVCWSPDGATVYCPSFTTIKVKKVFVSPTNGPETLIPALQAHQRLSSLPQPRIPDQLPMSTLHHNWNAFVNHLLSILGHQTTQLHNFLSSSAISSPSLLQEAYLKLKTDLSVWKLFKTLFGEIQQRELLDRFDDAQARDHLLQLARKHQLDALLSEMTLDTVKQELLEIGKRFDEQIASLRSDDDDSSGAKSKSNTDVSLGENVKQQHIEKQWKVLFCLLSGKRIKEAVSLALEMGEHRLALLMAQLGDPTTMAGDMKRQLQSWSKDGLMGPNAMAPYKLAVYSILAGEIRVVASEHRIPDWIRSFALFFWYSGPNPFGQSLETTINMYGTLAKMKVVDEGVKGQESSVKLPKPLPTYVSYLATSPSGSRGEYLDTLYHLMCLYKDREEYPLEVLLHPLTSSPRILDASLAWHLSTVFTASQIGDLPLDVAAEITVNFAMQLEMAGLWNFAFYVLLSLPSSTPLFASQRNHAIRQLLFRQVIPLQSTLVGTLHETEIDNTKLALLLSAAPTSVALPAQLMQASTSQTSTPTSLMSQPHLLNRQLHLWIYESLAQWYHYQRDYMQEIWMLFKCEQFNEAHNLLLNQWAPKVILDIGVDASLWPAPFILALQRLEEVANGNMESMSATSDKLTQWTFGGNIFLSLYRWYCAVKQSIQAWKLGGFDVGTDLVPSSGMVMESLDRSMLADLNQQSSTFLNLVNQYTDALQGLHQLVKQTAGESADVHGKTHSHLKANSTPAKHLWTTIPSLQGPAGLAMKQRTGTTEKLLQIELVCASELVSQLTSSISSLKLLIACIDADAPMPSPISAHTVPLSALETLDCLEPLQETFLPPDHLASNLTLLTSRYLDWRISAL